MGLDVLIHKFLILPDAAPVDNDGQAVLVRFTENCYAWVLVGAAHV